MFLICPKCARDKWLETTAWQHGLWHGLTAPHNTLQILGLDLGNSLSISQQGKMYLPELMLVKATVW